MHAIPDIWPNSKDMFPWYSLNAPINPDALVSANKYLNCDLDLTITEDNSVNVCPVIMFFTVCCIFLDTVS